MERIKGHCAILDSGVGVRAVCAYHSEIEVSHVDKNLRDKGSKQDLGTGAKMVGRIELNGKRVLVIGLARTGVATALFCAARGATVTATDTRSAEELAEAMEKLREAGVS